MLKRIPIVFTFLLFCIILACSCSRSQSTIVYLDTNKVVVYDNLMAACSSAQSTGLNITEIIPELGTSFIYYQNDLICLRVKVLHENLITSKGISDTIIEIYEIPETNFYLRISK